MNDTLPNKIKDNENGVINSDNSDGSGKHWIAYFNSDQLDKIYFFDSFGFPPSKNILKYLLTSGKHIAYNSNQIQNINSIACGSYCIEFIINMSKGKPFFDFIYRFYRAPQYTGSGIDENKFAERGKTHDIVDVDSEKNLKKVYLDPTSGLSGFNESARKTKIDRGKVKQFLETQDIYSKHKYARKKFPTRRVFIHKIYEQWQADLAEMIPYASENNGFKYLLTVIDCFSKYAWVKAIKSKNSDDIYDAFVQIFKKGRVPERLQTDHGNEFENKKVQNLFKSHNIKWLSTWSNVKASIVERFNRTLKEKMWKYFTDMGNNRYIDVLDKLVYNYNHSFHRSKKRLQLKQVNKVTRQSYIKICTLANLSLTN